MSDLFNVTSPPHVRAKDKTNKIMLYVIIALLPATVFGIYNFAISALILVADAISNSVVSG